MVLAWFLHSEGSEPVIPEMPGLTEPLIVLFSLFYILFYAPAHLLLNLGPRSVPFRQFAITTLSIWALFMPWIFIGIVAPLSVLGTLMALAGSVGFMIAMVRSYSRLYERSAGSTFGLFLLGNLPFSAVSTLAGG